MSPADFAWLPLFLALGLGGLAASRRLYGHWFTPLSVFLGINSASLFMYHLRIVELSDVSLLTHLVVLSALGVFSLGAMIATPARGTLAGLESRRRSVDARNIAEFFYITAILATLGWLIAAGILVGRFGLGILLRNVWMLQLTFQMQFIGYLNMIGILVLPTFVVKGGVGTLRWYDFLFLLSAVLGLMLAGIKAYLVYSILAGLMAWSTVRPDRFRFSYFASGMAVLLVFFVIYTAKVDVFAVETFARNEGADRVAVLLRPLVYFTGSWPAMDNLVTGQMEESLHFGAVTLQPIWKILGEGLGLVDPVPFALPFTFIGATPFNVYSFFGEVYWDWKWPGVLVFSFLLGILSTRLYLRARLWSYWGHTLIYAIIGYGVFFDLFQLQLPLQHDDHAAVHLCGGLRDPARGDPGRPRRPGQVGRWVGS